ncbi:hypothetical protein N2152v2_000886 [Parachlorella kessleri]
MVQALQQSSEPQDSLPPRPQVPAWVLRVAAGAALLLPLAGSHLALTPGAAQAARRRAAPPPPPPVETVSSEAASTPTAAVRQWLRDADLRRGELYSRYQTYMAPASGSRAGNHRAGMPSPLSDPTTARVATAVVVVAVALAALRMLSRRQPSGEGAGANGAQGAGADAGVQGTRVAPAAASPSFAPVDVRAPRAASRAAAAAVRPVPVAPAPAASPAPTVPPVVAAESVLDQTVQQQQQQAQQEQWRQQEQEWWRQQQREEAAAREEGDRAALAAAAQERIDRAKAAMGRAQQAQQELAAAMSEQGKGAEVADLADSAQRALQEAQRSMGEEAGDSVSTSAGPPPASQQRPSGGALRGASADDSSISSGGSRPGPWPAVPVQYPDGVPARPSGGALRGAGAGAGGSLQPSAATRESSSTGATTRGVGTGSGRAAPAPAGPAAPAQPAPAGEVGRGGGSSRSGPLPGGVPAAAPTPATPASQKPAVAPVSPASSSQASQSKGPADASSSTKGPGEKQAGVAEYLASGGARAPAVAVLGAFAAAKDALAPLLQPGKPASEAPNKPAPQPEAKLAPPPPPATQQSPPPPPQQAGGGWRQEVSRGSVVEPAERLWERQYQAQKAAAAGKPQPAAPGIASEARQAEQAQQVGAGTAAEPQETLPPKEQSPPQQPAAATEDDSGSAVLSELESAVQEHWQQQEEQLQAGSSAVAESSRVEPPGGAAAASGEPEASQEQQQQQEVEEKEEQLGRPADRKQRQQEETVMAQSEAADAAQRAQQEPSQQAQQGQEPQPGPEGSTPGTTPTEGEPNGAFGGLLTKLRASVDEHWQQQEQQLQPGLPASSSDPAVVARALQRAAEPEQGREAGAAVQPPQQGEPQQAQQAQQLLRLVAAGTSIPHPAKAESGGEDAFFVSGQGLGAVGVADGVGGWALEGINPALYPRQLLEQCEEGLAQHEEPLPVLLHAHDRAHAPGSCTVCLATLQAGAMLKLVSLGDCSAAVIRRGAGIVFKAETQEHQFNMPFQMASLKFLPGSDHPDQARQYEVAVQDGDVVVLGSDGLFDNLWEDDLVALVQARLEDLTAAPDAAALQAAAQQLAEQLALQAHSLAQDPTYVSPFAVERHERATSPFVRALSKPAGGKLDDVTVVVGVVSALSAPASGDESPGAGPGEAEEVKAPAAAGV